MARKKLTPEEESKLAAEAEQSREDDASWDYARARPVRRGGSPSAVLSVRVSIDQLRDLRKLAAVEGISLSELLKDAVASYVASAGPQVSSSGPRQLQLNLKRSSRSETIQPGARQLRDAGTAPYRPDTETTIAS